MRYACIPWEEHLRIYELYSARYGRGQSAERIAARGGFGVKEAVRLGYDNPLVVWFTDDTSRKDSQWAKVALLFDLEHHTFRYRMLSEKDYQNLDIFERVKDSYDRGPVDDLKAVVESAKQPPKYYEPCPLGYPEDRRRCDTCLVPHCKGHGK